MDKKIYDVLTEEYPEDELSYEVDPDITFQELYSRMCDGEDVYDLLGVGDSVVREHVFEEISARLNCDYDEVYNIWLNGGV